MISSPVEATLSLTFKPRSYSIDDSKVDYMSLLGSEDRKRRFSEVVIDTELKDSMRLQKLYRKMQRQVHCQQNKGSWVSNNEKRVYIFYVQTKGKCNPFPIPFDQNKPEFNLFTKYLAMA